MREGGIEGGREREGQRDRKKRKDRMTDRERQRDRTSDGQICIKSGMGTVMVDRKRPLRERYHRVVHMVIKDVETLRLELLVTSSVFHYAPL